LAEEYAPAAGRCSPRRGGEDAREGYADEPGDRSTFTLTNYCGFVDSFITAHPAYAKVVDQHQPGHVAPFEARHETERLGQQIS
jgi:hypothetical protein